MKENMNLDSAVFYSNDIEKVTKFYTEILNFEIEYRREDQFVSFVFNNGARLGIKKAVEDREVPGAQTIFISIDNINDTYKDIKNHGIEILKELTVKDYGTEFSILDPDKNKVLFIQRNNEN